MDIEVTYPSAEHRQAAEAVADFFSRQNIDAVLLTCSCARGKAVISHRIYPIAYDNVPEAIDGLDSYFSFYNTERFHQSLGYRTPQQVFFG